MLFRSLGSNRHLAFTPPPWTKREVAYLSGVMLAALVAHLAFIIEGPGEPDAARLLNDALSWHHTDSFRVEQLQYRGRILPLSLFTVKMLLDWGVPPAALPDLLNHSAAVIGTLLLIPLYVVFRNIVGMNAGLLGIVIVNFIPAYWASSIYGYPHIVSLAFAITSLALYILHLRAEGSRARVLFALAVGVLALATAVKADIILLAGAFAGTWLIIGRPGFRSGVALATLLAAGALSPILLTEYLLPPVSTGEGLGEFAVDWQKQWPISRWHLFQNQNLRVALFAGGVVLTTSTLFALGFMHGSERDRPIVLLVAAWSLPIFLFWGLREHNSARHLLAAVLPFGLAIGYLFTGLWAHARAQWGATGALLLVSYFSSVPNGSTVAPSTELIASRDLIQETVDTWMEASNGLLESGETRIAVVGRWQNPYISFAVFSKAKRIELDGYWQVYPKDSENVLVYDTHYVTSKAHAEEVARRYAEKGFAIWSGEFPELMAKYQDGP